MWITGIVTSELNKPCEERLECVGEEEERENARTERGRREKNMNTKPDDREQERALETAVGGERESESEKEDARDSEDIKGERRDRTDTDRKDKMTSTEMITDKKRGEERRTKTEEQENQIGKQKQNTSEPTTNIQERRGSNNIEEHKENTYEGSTNRNIEAQLKKKNRESIFTDEAKEQDSEKRGGGRRRDSGGIKEVDGEGGREDVGKERGGKLDGKVGGAQTRDKVDKERRNEETEDKRRVERVGIRGKTEKEGKCKEAAREGSMAEEETVQERGRISAVVARRPHYFHHHSNILPLPTMVMVAVVMAVAVVVVAPQPATGALHHQHQRRSPPYPHRLPLPLIRLPHKGGQLRTRGTRAALAPPTVTSLRPPDRKSNKQRHPISDISGGVTRSNFSPPVVASQSPSSANNNNNMNKNHNHHVSHIPNHPSRQGSMAPMATAASRSRSSGGTQQQDTDSWSETDQAMQIYSQHSEEALKDKQQGRDIHESSSDYKSRRGGGEGWAGLEGEASWEDVGGSHEVEGHMWREAGEAGEGFWVEGDTLGTSRNDTFGHAITEDLDHLYSRNSRRWRPGRRDSERKDSSGGGVGDNGGDGGGRSLSPSLVGGEHLQENTHLWVEEEGGTDKREERRGMEALPSSPPVSTDFLNAYIHAIEHYNETKRADGITSSHPSSSFPSSSHPSFTGFSSYPSLSSSRSSSSTYSSSTNMQEDLSPFHRSIVPQLRQPVDREDEYEPEDSNSYHEYDHQGRNTFPQEGNQQPSASPGQQGNFATHRNQDRDLTIQKIVQLKGLSTMHDLRVLLKKKGITFQTLSEYVDQGATESEVMAYLDRPDVATAHSTNMNFDMHNDYSISEDVDGETMNNYPGDERVRSAFDHSEGLPVNQNEESDNEDEVNDETTEGQEQKTRRRNRKKDRRIKGRRGRKNRKGKNKGGRRWRTGRKPSTTQAPDSSSPQALVDPEVMVLFSSTLAPITTKMLESSWQPHQPQSPSTATTGALLPPIPQAITTNQTKLFQPLNRDPDNSQQPQQPTTIPTNKSAKVSAISISVMTTPGDEHEDITVVEDLKPAMRRPNLRGKHEDYNRRHGVDESPEQGDSGHGRGRVRNPGQTLLEGPSEATSISHEQQKEEYVFPVKGIMIISGLMGAMAVFTLVVLISYTVIKCSKKPAVNNYQVSTQKNAPST